MTEKEEKGVSKETIGIRYLQFSVMFDKWVKLNFNYLNI